MLGPVHKLHASLCATAFLCVPGLRWATTLIGAMAMVLSGCAVDSGVLVRDRLQFNELVKTSAEEQMLLNIVRLRYGDTPSSLAISSIATQSEVVRSYGLIPFFGAVGNELQARGASRVLPQAQISIADRPTLTLTPLDDSDFTRQLFTPMPLEGLLYLAKTSWPISTVFRLWLENLNWVSNAQNASGPPAVAAPDFEKFLRGVDALQRLQDRAEVVFFTETREESIGGPIAAAQIKPADVIEAARSGIELRPNADQSTWTLMKKRSQPVLRIDSVALESPEMDVFATTFRLERKRGTFDIGVERLDPFPRNAATELLDIIDFETRSLLQVLYFVSKGVEVPAKHFAQRFAFEPIDLQGRPFDWRLVTRELFQINSSAAKNPPEHSHVSIRYLDHWYSLDRRDAPSMATFSLLLELARLETSGKAGASPTLTLPLTGR